jgi:3-oxoacyl-(acyl-carrier-protein) synthase
VLQQPMRIILQHRTPEGLGAKNVMSLAIEDSGLKIDDIDYINVTWNIYSIR